MTPAPKQQQALSPMQQARAEALKTIVSDPGGHEDLLKRATSGLGDGYHQHRLDVEDLIVQLLGQRLRAVRVTLTLFPVDEAGDFVLAERPAQ